jgi:DnaJ family protein C protein 28
VDLFEWQGYIERQIQQAQEEGEFDNLPGTGKPFTHLESDSLDNLLKAQGFAPRWLELDREIRQKSEIAEQAVRRTFEWLMQTWNSGSASQPFVEDEWREAQHVFGKRLDEINQLIKIFNLELPPPLWHLQKFPLKREEQLQRLGLPSQLR